MKNIPLAIITSMREKALPERLERRRNGQGVSGVRHDS